METIYRSLQKIAVLIFSLILLQGCTSSKVMEDNDARFKDINDEFSQVVKVKKTSAAPVVNHNPAPTVAETVAADLPQTNVSAVEAHKKVNTKNKKAEVVKPKPREPDIEDTEGFAGRRPIVDPFREGERVVLSVNYFNVEAGEFALNVNPSVIVNGRKAYHYSIDMQTSKTFSLFFAVNNTAETFVDYEDLVPHTYSMESKTSKQIKEVRTYFDWQKNAATQWEKTIEKEEGEKKKKIEWQIEPYSQNIISAIFYLRNFQLAPGKNMSFRVADDGKNLVFRGEVVRKETISTALGDMSAVVVKLSFSVGDQFKPTGDNLVWLTDDEHHYIVRIESKIKIGTLVAKLKSITKGRAQN